MAENMDKDPSVLILKIPGSMPWNRDYLHSQLDGKRRFEKKFPSLSGIPGLIVPPKKAIEQATSERISDFLSKGLKGKKLVDLSCGMGGDFIFLGRNFEESLGFELDPILFEIDQHNLKVLGRNSTIKNQDGLGWISSNEKVDLVIVDPDRRSDGKRIYRFQDSSPNLVGRIPELIKSSEQVWVKSSPFLDLDYGIKELGDPKAIRVISVNQECKQLLFQFGDDEKELGISLDWLDKGEWVSESLSWEDWKKPVSEFEDPKAYLLDPNPSYLKTQAFAHLTEKFGVKKISRDTHLFSCSDIPRSWPGRVFEIEKEGNQQNLKELRKGEFEIYLRNYKGDADPLRKKLQNIPSKKKALFVYSDQRNKTKWLLTKPK